MQRKLILDALFATGVPDALRHMREGLSDPSMNVQITAVEYLGRLEDRQSVDLLNLFRDETEPMLRIAILEAISLIECRKTDIEEFVSILASYGDFALADPLYYPQAIRLSAKNGDSEIMCSIVSAITEIDIYAEDIIYAIEDAEHRFTGFSKEECILEIIGQDHGNHR
ncbi:MAG: HEAT repeat domain-containing protein [Desulfobacteraceae bacterium]|nr:HEAT repeat domain-containing protein [Desulfobacteraceae bacterium]